MAERAIYPAFEAFCLIRILGSDAGDMPVATALQSLLVSTRETVDLYGVAAAAARSERDPQLLSRALEVISDMRTKAEGLGFCVARHFCPIGEPFDLSGTAAALAVSAGARPLSTQQRSLLESQRERERESLSALEQETPWTLALFLRWFQVNVLVDRLTQYRPDLDASAPQRAFAHFLAVDEAMSNPTPGTGSLLRLTVLDGLAACNFGEPAIVTGPHP